ncbi:MAG TPA: hypothetical protein VFW40_12915 [Capsulimonadaceae bacterium]|nr:hypothetical protein [Capsulimonadaceae bacterium]
MIVSKLDVLRHFVSQEIEKHSNIAIELTQILSISNDEEFVSRLRRFASKHDSNNPVYAWTGLNANQHHERVRSWVKATDIRTDSVYSKGINPTINNYLNDRKIRGNLKQIADRATTDVVLRKEFDLSRQPVSEEKRTIIGVVHRSTDHDGTIELIDGAHRFVSMAANGVTEVPAFLAELS